VILIMVLGFFLITSGIVVEEYTTTSNTYAIATKVYLKEQAYYQAKEAFKSFVSYFKVYFKNEASYDSLDEFLPFPIKVPLKNGWISISVIDEDRFLNLNIVKSQVGAQIIKRLFKELKVNSLHVSTLRTWITGKGFWDKSFPIKKSEIEDKRELLFLGMSEEDFYGKVGVEGAIPGISEFVTVWGDGKVNINTAPKEVLLALFPSYAREIVDEVISYRTKHPFKKVDDLLFVNGMNFQILHALRPWIKVKSNYFKVIIEVKVGDVEGSLTVVLKRVGPHYKVVYWRYS